MTETRTRTRTKPRVRNSGKLSTVSLKKPLSALSPPLFGQTVEATGINPDTPLAVTLYLEW